MKVLTALVPEHKSILTSKSFFVKNVDNEIKSLSLNLIHFAIINNGVGLASPQIGVLKRVFVAKTRGQFSTYINPKYIKKSKETNIQEEGCLSLPGMTFKVPRHNEIKIRYQNENEETKIESFFGNSARIIQHEMDHLDGILIYMYKQEEK